MTLLIDYNINFYYNIDDNIENININLRKYKNFDIVNLVIANLTKVLENIIVKIVKNAINNNDTIDFKIVCKNITNTSFELKVNINSSDFNVIIDVFENI